MQAKVKLTLHFTHTHTKVHSHSHTYAHSIEHLVTHTLRTRLDCSQVRSVSTRACVYVWACICIGMMTRPHCLSFIEPSSAKYKRIELLFGTKTKWNEMWVAEQSAYQAAYVWVRMCVCVSKSQSGCAFIMYPAFDCRHVWAYTIGI